VIEVVYGLLASLAILCHFLWILFLVFGVIFALKGSKIAWIHLGGLLFSLLLNLLGWYCPLTYLENYFQQLYHRGLAYSGSFIIHYLEPIVYPNLSERTLRIGGIVFVILNLFAYGVFARRYLRKV
jgi:hypothetical protein